MVEKHRDGMVNLTPRQVFLNAYRAWRIRVKARELKKLVRAKGAVVDLAVDVEPKVVSSLEAALRYAFSSVAIAEDSADPIVGRAKRRLAQQRRRQQALEKEREIERTLAEIASMTPREREKLRNVIRQGANAK